MITNAKELAVTRERVAKFEKLLEVLRLRCEDDDTGTCRRFGVRERRLDAVPVVQLRHPLGAAGRHDEIGRAGAEQAGEQRLADLSAAEDGDAAVHPPESRRRDAPPS